MPDAYEINVRNAPTAPWATDRRTTAFQAALDDAVAAATSGSVFGGVSSPIGIGSAPVVVIPFGAYKTGSALTVPPYLRIVGQDAILIGPGPDDDIFSMQAHDQSIQGLTFVGGRYQVNATTAAGNLYLTECKFFRPSTSAFRTASGTNNGYFHLVRCQFLGQYRLTVTGATNASPIVVTTSDIHGPAAPRHRLVRIHQT